MVDQDRRRSLAACSSACCSGFSRGVRARPHERVPFGRLPDGSEVEVYHAGLGRRPAGRNPHARRHAAQPHAARGKAANASRWCCRCRICRPISRTLLISASSSAATAIASPAPRSSSTASVTRSPPTTAPTRCTAATWASANTCGRCWARGGGKNTYVKLGPSLAGRHQRLSGQPRRHRADQRLREHADAGVRGHHRRADADQPHLASLLQPLRAIRAAASTSSGSR